jgi:hypothetical protein
VILYFISQGDLGNLWNRGHTLVPVDREDPSLIVILTKQEGTRMAAVDGFMVTLSRESRDIYLVPMSYIVSPTIRERLLLGVDREPIVIVTAGFRGAKGHDPLSLRVEICSN